MFDGKPRIEELLKSGKLSILEQEFLKTIPFEPKQKINWNIFSVSDSSFHASARNNLSIIKIPTKKNNL